jgi:hypothetical protein
MVVPTSNLPDVTMPELCEIGVDQIGGIFILGHFDIVLHFGMVYLARGNVDL